MSYKYLPQQENRSLTQKEVNDILKADPKQKPKKRTPQEKAEMRRLEANFRRLQKLYASVEVEHKKWLESRTPEVRLISSIEWIVRRFAEVELKRNINVYDIYKGMIEGNSFVIYSFVAIDFKLPERFYINEDGKQYKLELDLCPLSHNVELVTRRDNNIELTFPFQKTVFKIRHIEEITKEMRDKDSLKNAIMGLQIAKLEIIPEHILRKIHFVFNLSPASALNPQLMLEELRALDRNRGQLHFTEEMERQLEIIHPGITCFYPSPGKWGDIRTKFVLDQSEIYEGKVRNAG